MAERLLRYYKYAQDELGLLGKIHLAKETKMPSIQAALEPDSPENLLLFKNAVEKLMRKPAPDF